MIISVAFDSVTLIDIAGKHVLSVKRYDRLTKTNGEGMVRIHQQDACQALQAGLSPNGVREVVRLTIKRVSESSDGTRLIVAKTNDAPFLKTLADTSAERARICAGAMD